MAFSEAIVPSASRTAAPTNAPFNYTSNSQKFVDVIVDVTVNAGGLGSITVDVVGVDPASGQEYLILSTGALTAVATKLIQIGPGLPSAANSTQNQDVPATFRIKVTHNNANPITYSVGINLQ
jgi:hypothetical protein